MCDRRRAHVVKALFKGVTITMGGEVDLSNITVGDAIVVYSRFIWVGPDREFRGGHHVGGCVAGVIVS